MTSFSFLKIFSDVLQGSILGPIFFLIDINNLSNDIVSLVKQKYVNAHVSACIMVGLMVVLLRFRLA